MTMPSPPCTKHSTVNIMRFHSTGPPTCSGVEGRSPPYWEFQSRGSSGKSGPHSPPMMTKHRSFQAGSTYKEEKHGRHWYDKAKKKGPLRRSLSISMNGHSQLIHSTPPLRAWSKDLIKETIGSRIGGCCLYVHFRQFQIGEMLNTDINH